MANLNKIILVGRLTADPEARFSVDGLPITKFCLAVNRFGDKQTADFINIVSWRKVAEVCGQYLKKGQLVLVEGRIQVRSYDDQGGKRKWVTEVAARVVKMLGRGKDASEQSAPEPDMTVEEGGDESPIEEFEEFARAGDDLPF
ncbi:MAG: single-stranded DNA-binding protein [Candidatus Margulisiibacteriota bacterium]|nr:single-stranded DNA-binding protein [Candidatus Margulisiibacteriota bacterium]